ncbi:histidine-rich glycoprotein-like isoform X2 [Argiope bruennichi]|uniref:Uncharacterized protein n=1 Tax=Argiope bruennichi TaxID=94029 RepID=A0A8T0EZA2_ARGBR|nr:histidine-rich glycoprotein-like isoform X2 [Argiope bruennichi]KAF8783390.1 hypothetical protein HNY73_013555 [Argiope bruennichi]
MKTVIALLLALLATFLSEGEAGDLTAEASQQKIYEIIDSHENHKYGDHGGHEYEEGEIAQKQASRKRYGYLPVNAESKVPVYYDDAPKYGLASKENLYRENVAAYAPKVSPAHLADAPHQVIASPISHSHYAIVDPITKNHQYVIFKGPKPHYESPQAFHPKSSYILEEKPHYVVSDHNIVTKPIVPHFHPPLKDYSHHSDRHLLDKSHHTSGHGHYDDNSAHGGSEHKSHKKHEISGHKSHSASGGHRDEHDHHHNRAHYERDRGYHYEKAYAYDRIRADHDIGSSKGAHSDYKSHHDQEGYKNLGSHGAHGKSYFKKHGEHGEYGHQHNSALYKGGHHAGGQGYHDHGLKYLSPHHHAYGK